MLNRKTIALLIAVLTSTAIHPLPDGHGGPVVIISYEPMDQRDCPSQEPISLSPTGNTLRQRLNNLRTRASSLRTQLASTASTNIGCLARCKQIAAQCRQRMLEKSKQH